ncbi:MAG: two-component regulator propeller domain-containing protein, partial [Candidatus Latescibacteria bacterium]|nr:two-component regulator propeller domain-containing protein [Candidatus Latescibacterota bacterium]
MSRYDGHVWQKFGVEDGLPGNAVLDLVSAPDGALWAAVGRQFGRLAQHSLAYFKKGKWIGIQSPERLVGRRGVRQILGLDGGRACLVTDDGRLLRFDGEYLHVVTSNGEPLRNVQSLMRDANGKIWVAYGGGRDRGIYGPGLGPGRGERGRGRRGFSNSDGSGSGRGERGRGRRGFSNSDGSGSGRGKGRGIPDGFDDRGGFGWRGEGSRGLGVLDVATGAWEAVAGMDSLASVSVLAMAQSGDGAIWFGTDEGGLKRYDSGQWQTFTIDHGLPSNRVQVIRFTQDGTMWIGTPAGAAVRDGAGHWRSFAEREGLPNSDVVDICIAEDGAVWVGTRGGVARLGLSGWMHHLDWPGRQGRGATVLALDHRGELWAGNDALYRFDEGIWRSEHKLERNVRGRLLDLFTDGKGTLWAVTLFQLWRYEGASWEVVTPDRQIGLPFRTVGPAQDGGVWGLTRSGIYRFDPSADSEQGQAAWTLVDPDAFGISICETSDGTLWLGQIDGVIRVIDGKQQKFTASDGIPDGPISTIVEDIGGRIWVSSPLEGVAHFNGQRWRRIPGDDQPQFNGVNRIYPAHDGTVWLASPIDGAIHTDGFAWARYTVREGLPSTQVWDVGQDDAGQLWFATAEGLGCYRPDDAAPETHLLAPPVQIAPHQRAMFEFTGQDVWKQTPDWSLQYAWRLNGGAWSPFSRESRVLVKELDAGMHQFEVRAMDLAFNVDPMPAIQVFEVLAPVWQRPWFVGLSGVSLLTLLLTTGY